MNISTWKQVARSASHYRTPFYLIWPEPFVEMLTEIRSLAASPVPFRHWYSFKSQPVPKLAQLAREMAMGIEVVSRFELHAARTMGFPPEDILVNGVAKNKWLVRDVSGINVIFDSINELEQLASTAAENGWRCGIRVAVSQQKNADLPAFPAQFGIARRHMGYAREVLNSANVAPDILHFHLRSNVPTANEYIGALSELSDIAGEFFLSPKVIDIGGGLSEPFLNSPGAAPLGFPLQDYSNVIERCSQLFPEVSEIWAENGRCLLASSAVLVTTIVDAKYVDDYRILICDGGRTNHATPSDWERHLVDLLDEAGADETEKTVIYGPTCMAYDTFHQGLFPRRAKIGDRIIYFNAGAYHLPWETRFSTGLCRVLWTVNGRDFEEIRPEESVNDWLAAWRDP